MSIVKMDRLTVIGLEQDKESVVEALMRLGAVEVVYPDLKDQQETQSGLTADSIERTSAGKDIASADTRGLEAEHSRVIQTISRLDRMIKWLEKYNTEKKPAFASRRQVSPELFMAMADREAELLGQVSMLEQLQARQNHLGTEINRLDTRIELLQPWLGLDLDLVNQETEHVKIFLGSFDSRDQVEEFQDVLPDEAPETDLTIVSEDEQGLRCAVFTWRHREAIIRGHLRRLGFDLLPFQGQEGKPSDLYLQAEKLRDQYKNELEKLLEEEKDSVVLLPDLKLLHDYCLIRSEKLHALAGLPSTEKTFWLEGWVPTHLAAAVDKGLRTRFLVAVEMRPAAASENYPILFKNNRFVKPYEVIVEMFSPPSTQEVDPSPLLAPFFFFFFGMMLSDVGYGLLMTGLCLFLLYKVKVSGEMARMSRMLLMSGIASTLWGFVFGGFFGDMLFVLSGEKLLFPAIWFNPMDDPTRLMIWSMVFGIIHIFAGMGAKAYMLFITGQWKAAILDVFPWYFLLSGLGLMIGGIGGSAGLYLVIAAAAVLVLFGGREAKNPIIRLLKGILSLYGITGYFSDILSYTRILALVLATSVIAMVVNLLGFLLGPTPLGIIVFIFIAVAGHALNLALSALSAYVHTSRLHFVEFFGKFYEGGGRMWRPLKLNTRYIDIVREPRKVK